VTGDGAVRVFTDLFFGRGQRQPERGVAPDQAAPWADCEPVPTKALARFLTTFTNRSSPTLLDLGAVVGSNISFFGERLGCKIYVEDLFSDVERLAREERSDTLSGFFRTRLTHASESIDGILAWDLFDFLDRVAAEALSEELARLLRPGGVLLSFFSTSNSRSDQFTKYVIIDDSRVQHRTYPAPAARRQVMQNRDILRMFSGLQVLDSFLLQSRTREMLFRKPSAAGQPPGEGSDTRTAS
jgi:SAM-dependent methyltransferase